MATTLGVLGAGHWGGNLIRVFAELAGQNLKKVVDPDASRLNKIRANFPFIETSTDPEAVFQDESIDAVVIATPASDHYPSALKALSSGKHTFVEKPLALNRAECAELIAKAESSRLTLMVGHTFLYNAAVRKLRELISDGTIGDVFYLYSQRLNLGRIRRDVDALWNFAPHDISIAMYILDAVPERVAARGFSYLQNGVDDVSFLTLYFSGGIAAQIHVSWLDPRKVRQMTVVGSRKMVLYDDVAPDAKIVIYDKGVYSEQPEREDVATFGEFQLLTRSGDVTIPQIKFTEPLKTEAAHFLECIEKNGKPLSDGENGRLVVAVLEAADRSRKKGGVPVPLEST
ncbi:MAG: gfo/Idh/MocA family oxidoreductase [Candidatus Hydrogenedentota bacterium]|nr:MAG: gfo/Idh/MocA family oxidoreductase [Candidatus Hydrogenedentota bacterium]